jgi:transposase
MVHDLRSMCDAVAYVIKNGVEWRALRVDFPPREAVYAFFERWNGRGLPAELVRRLRELLWQHQVSPPSSGGGERPRPTGQTALSAGSKVVAFYGDRFPASGR